MKRVILIDGNSIMFRAYYATAYSNQAFMMTKSGIHTNALFAFVNMFEKIVNKGSTDVLVAFDTEQKTERHIAYQDYKAGRKAMPEELAEQIDIIYEYIRLKGVKLFYKGGYEADDIIGTLAKQASKKGYKVDVYSSDKDLLQLVDEFVTVNLLKSGMKEVRSYTPQFLVEETGLTHEQMIDLKALMGDASDNIKGVPGIGEKTAVKLLQDYQSLDNIYDSIDQITGSVKNKLLDGRKSAYQSKYLATILLDVPLGFTCDEICVEPIDYDALLEFFMKYEMNVFLKNVKKESKVAKETEYQEIDDYQKLEKVLKPGIAVYLEQSTSNYHRSELWGFGLSNGKDNYFLEPDFALSSIDFITFLGDAEIPKLTFDYKALIVALKWRKIVAKGFTYDMQLAAYLSNSRLGKEDFSTICQSFSYLDVRSDDAVYGRGAKKDLGDKSNYARHIAAKALAIYQLKDIIGADLKSKNQLSLLNDIEIPLSEVLADMEYTGIRVDLKELENQKTIFGARIKELERKICSAAGEDFNVSSPKQLGAILFEKLGMESNKKNKSGYSTDVDVLEKLRDKHEIIDLILDYRKLSKLYSTYIDGLKQVLFEDDKAHTIYMQALTTTGRLSSIEPNLQNIPIRTELGREIRKLFVVSSPNNSFVGCDYSQIELRVLADIANVSRLIEAFNNNEDIHTKTAQDVFHVDTVNDDQRRKAKAVNFGIIYGIGAFSLAQDIGVTRKDAQIFIDRYLGAYPEIKKYMDDTINFAKENGYVETLLKRRRYIPEIASANFNERSFGERTAMNARIQGTAADIIKIAMIKLHQFIGQNKLASRLVLQIHDELILEVPSNEVELMRVELPNIMNNAYSLKVKVETSLEEGNTWFDLK